MLIEAMGMGAGCLALSGLDVRSLDAAGIDAIRAALLSTTCSRCATNNSTRPR